MAHHGSGPFDEDPERVAARDKLMKELLASSSQFRGALGDFPEGTLSKADEGSIQFAIGEKNGKVVLDFGTPVTWIGMNPQQAADLASSLFKRAREVARRTGDLVSIEI